MKVSPFSLHDKVWPQDAIKISGVMFLGKMVPPKAASFGMP